MSHIVRLSVCIYALMSCAKIAQPIEMTFSGRLLVQGMLYYMRVQIVSLEEAIPRTTAGLLRKQVSLPLRRQFNTNILYDYYCYCTRLTASFPGKTSLDSNEARDDGLLGCSVHVCVQLDAREAARRAGPSAAAASAVVVVDAMADVVVEVSGGAAGPADECRQGTLHG